MTSSDETHTKKHKKTAEEYDDFLQFKKQDHFVRVGEFGGMSKGTLHRCMDAECAREWKPSPMQCLPEDYFCPSCVLHHRNNVNRFKQDRLKWTADVPNTLYVFSIRDPNGTQLIKFGRTQHTDAWLRYPTKERRDYEMKLLLQIRGRLETMTIIENWWKDEAENKKLYCQFSDKAFHGMTECIKVNSATLDLLLKKSQEMAEADKSTKAIVKNDENILSVSTSTTTRTTTTTTSPKTARSKKKFS